MVVESLRSRVSAVIVAPGTGGFPEVAVQHDAENGRLVEPNDPRPITSALEQLANESVRAALALRARASVADHDIRLTTERMAEVWRGLGVTV